jgi:membrane protease YdiL (CAAX protease family)
MAHLSDPREPGGEQADAAKASKSDSGIANSPSAVRSGLGITTFIGLLVALRVLQYFLFTKKLPHDWMRSPRGLLADESLRVVVVLFVTGLLARFEGRRLTDYGLRGAQAVRLCFIGGLWGVATLSLLVEALKLTGALALSGPEMGGLAAVRYGVQWLLAFLAVAIFEEMTLRGYLQYTLAKLAGFWRAALIWSLVFALMHGTNGGERIVGLVQSGLIALFFCLSLWLTGSLWWAIGFHAAWDWAESYLYGAADSGLNVTGHLFSAVPRGNALLSGGSTGPEGSILSLFILAIPTAGLWFIYRGAGRTV